MAEIEPTMAEPTILPAPLRVTIVGAGGTGTEIARTLIQRGHVSLTMIDVSAEMVIGKSIDLQQSGPLLGSDVAIKAGGDSLEVMAGSQLIVVTAGRGRRPGEPREEMLKDNGRLIAEIAKTASHVAPDAYIIVLTNPADLLTRVAFETSGFPLARIMGQGGILDSARMSFHVAATLGVSVKDVRSLVLGGHGDTMVPVEDFVSVHGAPAKHLLPEDAWADIVRRTRYGGEEILSHFRTHGASVTPGLAVCEMIDALRSPTPRLLPISTMPQGEYGLRDVFLGLPALLSNRGVHGVIELPLSPANLAMLHKSADAQRRAWEAWKRLQ